MCARATATLHHFQVFLTNLRGLFGASLSFLAFFGLTTSTALTLASFGILRLVLVVTFAWLS